MKRILFALALACCSKPPAGNHVEAVKAADVTWRVVDGPGSLAAFAKEANAAGLKPYAYLHASWCGPCNAIEETHTTDARMADAFKRTAIALIDIDANDLQVLAAAGMDGRAIPVFFKLDANGKPTGDRIDGGAWGNNVPENMAPPLKAFFAR